MSVHERLDASWVADRLTPDMAAAALRTLALSVRVHPQLRQQLWKARADGSSEPLHAAFNFVTRDRRARAWLRIQDGRMQAGRGELDKADVTVVFRDEQCMRRFFVPATEHDVLAWMVSNDLTCSGNLAWLAKFGHIASAVRRGGKVADRQTPWPSDTDVVWSKMAARHTGSARPMGAATGAQHLPDPAFATWSIDDFPRLKRALHTHLHTRARLCTERARLCTEAMVREWQREGDVSAVLSRARVLAHVLRRKRAIVREDDLLLGTTTSHAVGAALYPELGGTSIWPELLTLQLRSSRPLLIHERDARILDEKILPAWMQNNVREWARRKHRDPRSLRLASRQVLYALGAEHASAHLMLDLPAVLRRGLRAVAEEARERKKRCHDAQSLAWYEAVIVTIDAVHEYARRLSEEAERLARATHDPHCRADLLQAALCCRRSPAEPARTLHDALNAIWLCLVAVQQESFFGGLPLGRLDAWLQPYFERDINEARSEAQREAVRRRSLELVAAFLLKCTDHVPLVSKVGDKTLEAGSYGHTITVGGVMPDGSSAVSDTTYLLLKAAEMLGLHSPQLHARCSADRNPEYYLRRVCEVAVLTGAVPVVHNDQAVLKAVVNQGIPIDDARNWAVGGAMQPLVCGAHVSQACAAVVNMVAPVEMALHDGVHPLLHEQVGPHTGKASLMGSFTQVMQAYKTHLAFVIDRAAETSNMLFAAHQSMLPVPLASSMVQGTMEAGRDVVAGGARYSGSGMAFVGFADAVDSLVAIRTLVFDTKQATMAELVQALEADFVGHEQLLAAALAAPKFGDGHALSQSIADELVQFIYARTGRQADCRGGRYLPGYWSLSLHVAMGAVAGALPSGRRRGKPFSNGISPSPLARGVLHDTLRQVGSLEPAQIPAGYGLTLTMAPGPDDTDRILTERLTNYVRTYFRLGGMHVQFNVVSRETMRDAVERPSQHRDLLVGISGYSGYFVELGDEVQMELLARPEHR